MNTEFITYNNFTKILIIFFPIALITGPFLTDFFLTLVVLIFIAQCIYKKNFNYFKTKFFLIFSIFWVYILINSLLQNQNIDSIKISFFYIRFGIFVLAIWYALNTDKKIINYLFFSIAFCYLALIIDGYFQFIFKENSIGIKLDNSGRVSSFFGEELILGSYLSRLFPIFFATTIFIYKKKSKLIYLASICFIFADTLIFFSGERTAFFYANFSAILMIVLFNKFKKLRFYTFVISIGLIFVFSYFNDVGQKRIIGKTLDQMNLKIELDENTKNSNKSISNKKEILVFSKQHQEHYISALKIFKDNMFFGVGVKNFRIFCAKEKYYSKYSCSTHPHNSYIQLLAEIGLIGFSFLIYAFFILIKFTFIHFLSLFKRKSFFNDFEICLITALFISLWPFVPNGNFFNNWLSAIYYFPCGILFWSLTKKGKKI